MVFEIGWSTWGGMRATGHEKVSTGGCVANCFAPASDLHSVAGCDDEPAVASSPASKSLLGGSSTRTLMWTGHRYLPGLRAALALQPAAWAKLDARSLPIASEQHRGVARPVVATTFVQDPAGMGRRPEGSSGHRRYC